jgi:hypothetical protein
LADIIIDHGALLEFSALEQSFAAPEVFVNKKALYKGKKYSIGNKTSNLPVFDNRRQYNECSYLIENLEDL